MLIGNGSGTTYLAGTVCFVLNGPYVARTEIGCELWNTVKRSIDKGEPLVAEPSVKSGLEMKCWRGNCLRKKPPSLFSK